MSRSQQRDFPAQILSLDSQATSSTLFCSSQPGTDGPCPALHPQELQVLPGPRPLLQLLSLPISRPSARKTPHLSQPQGQDHSSTSTSRCTTSPILAAVPSPPLPSGGYAGLKEGSVGCICQRPGEAVKREIKAALSAAELLPRGQEELKRNPSERCWAEGGRYQVVKNWLVFSTMTLCKHVATLVKNVAHS